MTCSISKYTWNRNFEKEIKYFIFNTFLYVRDPSQKGLNKGENKINQRGHTYKLKNMLGHTDKQSGVRHWLKKGNVISIG